MHGASGCGSEELVAQNDNHLYRLKEKNAILNWLDINAGLNKIKKPKEPQ